MSLVVYFLWGRVALAAGLDIFIELNHTSKKSQITRETKRRNYNKVGKKIGELIINKIVSL